MRAWACICVCADMHKGLCFVVVCPGIHRCTGCLQGIREKCSFRVHIYCADKSHSKMYLPTHPQENIKIATAYNYEDTQLEVELALKTAVVKELHDT